jgi:hypothetical protein
MFKVREDFRSEKIGIVLSFFFLIVFRGFVWNKFLEFRLMFSITKLFDGIILLSFNYNYKLTRSLFYKNFT